MTLPRNIFHGKLDKQKHNQLRLQRLQLLQP
jgi:hypothetical protein